MIKFEISEETHLGSKVTLVKGKRFSYGNWWTNSRTNTDYLRKVRVKTFYRNKTENKKFLTKKFSPKS